MVNVISFEGINACGKSTIISGLKDSLEDRLKEKDIDIFTFRCPGSGIPEIRDLMKNNKYDPFTYSMLSLSDIFELYNREIKPRIQRNDNCLILLDRYIDSLFVYQGYLGKVNPIYLKTIYEFGVSGFYPDLTIWLDSTYDQIVSRRKKQEGTDVWESGDFEETCRSLRYGYECVYKQNPNRVVRINSDIDIDMVQDAIYTKIKNKFNI
jgi:dTMP kinase